MTDMSRKRQMIELEAPPLSMTEHYTLTGFVCPECHGMGWYWGEGFDESGETGTVKCPCRRCGGTGQLDAEITVNWKKQMEEI